MMGPVIDELAKEMEGKAKVGKLNVDSSQTIAGEYGIMSIPSIKIFKGGKIVKEFVGVQSKDTLKKALEELV
jgi:thioredoxin 1